ncbi:MAG TPA: ATP-binding protein, partial [Nitrososphaeraceae archaeon]|nr:ATP-binding protein [Nitrososphaeraceae archaeon]
LDITKIENNALTLNKERFSLTEKIREAVADTITNQIRKDASNNNKNIKVKFDSKVEGRENDIFVEADKTRIYQIISNLLKNAIKFINEGGTITVTADISTKKVEAEEEGEKVVVVKIKDRHRNRSKCFAKAVH